MALSERQTNVRFARNHLLKMAKKATAAQPAVTKVSKKVKAAKQAAVVAETKKVPKKVRADCAFISHFAARSLFL